MHINDFVYVDKVCGCFGVPFHVLQLLLIGFTQQHSCCISKFMMKHLQKLDWKLDLPWSSCGYQKCMLLIS
jgi:hypothetical protein